MKIRILLFIFYLFLAACQKDGVSRTSVYWKNSTDYDIWFVPFHNGLVDCTKVKSLLPHGKTEIQSHQSWGKATSPAYLAEYFRDLDSIWVIWEDTFKVTHMLSGDYFSSGKCIRFHDTANIIGYISRYKKETLHDGKHSMIFELTRHFTEADFEFAKE